MRLFVLLGLILVVTCVVVDSGRIVRTWRRRGGGGMMRRQSNQPWSPFQYWTRYFRPNPRRVIRRHHIPTPLLRQHHQEKDQHDHAATAQPQNQNGRSKALTPWRPLEYGNPIARDPTYDYAPPTNENVKFGNPNDSRRRQLSGPPRRRWRPRPPPRMTTSLWRLLTQKQRRPMRPRRPRPPHPHHQHPNQQQQQSDEAEVTPYLPNIVYFQPKDFIPTTSTSTTSTTTEKSPPGSDMKPGHVSDVPLYPTQSTSASEFQPIEAFKPMPVEKEYIFRVLSVTPLNREPTLLQPLITEAPPSPTERTAPAPTLEASTESIMELLQQPPSPINSFNINIDPGAEGSDDFLKFVEIPKESVQPQPEYITTSTTSTTTTASIPEPSSTTDKFIPIFPVRTLISSSAATTTTTSTTSSTTTTESPTEGDEVHKNHRVHPTMTAYKKRPVFPKKPSTTVNKVSWKVSPGLGSGESITITGIRSKVKEYKPQHLANYTQLLSFDKVADTSSSPLPVVVVQLPTSLSTELPVSDSTEKSNSSTTSVTSSSPMQQFDPLKLIHSWFIKN